MDGSGGGALTDSTWFFSAEIIVLVNKLVILHERTDEGAGGNAIHYDRSLAHTESE